VITLPSLLQWRIVAKSTQQESKLLLRQFTVDAGGEALADLLIHVCLVHV
jgi:hypothetical protein